jgi:hypothetical protein
VTATHHEKTTGDPLAGIADRMREEAAAIRQAFAELDAERHEAWEHHAAEVRESLAEMQRDLDEARERLAEQRRQDRAEMRDELDALLVALHGRYDDLWVQLRLVEMDTSDRVQAVREEGERILARGRTAAARARDRLRELAP